MPEDAPWRDGATQDQRWDGYLINPKARFTDPDYGVLVNKLGLTTDAPLRTAEAALSEHRALELRVAPIAGRYDTAHMQAIHRHLFQDVYPWAGELRTVNMSKGYGPAFIDYPHVPVVVDGIADALRERDYLRGLGREDFVDTLAVVYNAVNTAHPFREGNGRTQRAMWDQLAGDAGYRIDWLRVRGDENDIASETGRQGDLTQLRDMLDKIVASTRPEPQPLDEETARFVTDFYRAHGTVRPTPGQRTNEAAKSAVSGLTADRPATLRLRMDGEAKDAGYGR